MFLLALLLAHASGGALERYGKVIRVPFPNDEVMLGLGGLVYDPTTEFWTATAESISGSSVTAAYPEAATPRFYRFQLDFDTGTITYAKPAYVEVRSDGGFKLEDIAALPVPSSPSASSHNDTFWLVSESHSAYVPFLLDFFSPAHDINTYDRATFAHSRLVQVRAADGAIIREASLPLWMQWDQRYDWDWSQCTGTRVFQGLHALSIFTNDDGGYTLLTANQAALFQDGGTPNDWDGSHVRLLAFDIDKSSGAATYSHAYRYSTSERKLKPFEKSARHFTALSALLFLDGTNGTSVLVAETENYVGFTQRDHVNRIFRVHFNPSDTVDHCESLLSCDVPAPEKHLVWEQHGGGHLDGMTRGPNVMVNGRELGTVALVYELDTDIGATFELLTVDQDALLKDANPWPRPAGPQAVKDRQAMAIWLSLAAVLVIVLIQCAIGLLHRPPAPLITAMTSTPMTKSVTNAHNDTAQSPKARAKWKYKHYILVTVLANSFLVGGLTFGLPSMMLMLRKEGVYAERCSCGTFCMGQKDAFALVSTIGFGVTIGARLFIGIFLDKHGPKITAILSFATCLSGIIVMILDLDFFLLAWVLLSVGGSGVHLAGFHVTNMFDGDTKTAASATISAAFGSSALVLAAMQPINQFAGVSLQHLMVGYFVLVLALAINNFFVQPWDMVEAGIPIVPDLRCYRRRWWKRAVYGSKPIVWSAVREMRRFDFWGEMLFFSVNLFVMTYYLSVMPQLLHAKGAIPFGHNPNDWEDYQFQRLSGIFNGLGALWLPTVEHMLTRLSWDKCFCALLFSNLLFVGLLTVPALECQVVAFALQSFSRLMLFSFHHTYLLETFGVECFGIMNGITAFGAAIFGLLGYPLQLFALSVAGGDFAISMSFVGAALVVSGLFPLAQRYTQVSNWAQTAYVDPRKFYSPRTIDELAAFVTKAKKLRVAGTMHSCAPLIDSEGKILRVSHLDRILEIDVHRKVVRMQPGVTIDKLCAALAEHGLAIGTLGTIDWQTAVGAVMTGTHGGSKHISSLHTFMKSYTLVKADGSIMTVRREEEPELFSAIAPSMGVFGVVVEAEMHCVELQHLEASFTSIPFKDIITQFEQIVHSNKYSRVVVYPSLNVATVWTANPIKEGEAAARGAIKTDGYMNFRNPVEKAMLQEWLRLTKKGALEEAKTVLRHVLDSQKRRLTHYEGQYNHVLCKERNHGIPHADMELAFDLGQAEQVLSTAYDHAQVNNLPYYNFEVRCTKSDDAMLSACNGRDTMWIDFQACAGNVQQNYFGEMEDLYAHLGYRKHWAKGMDHMDPNKIMAQYPQLPIFMQLMWELDPERKFSNAHVDLFFASITAASSEP